MKLLQILTNDQGAIVRLRTIIFYIFTILIFHISCTNEQKEIGDLFTFAKSRSNDLQLGIYITAHSVNDYLATEAGRREAISIFRANGITKAIVEVYRSGLVVDKDLLENVKNHFINNNIEVAGGIATVPGKNFGIRQEGQLGWFNWQNPKTQDDLKKVMEMSAKIFDEFIVDDFLCTADTSLESNAAKGDRTWSQYRRDLLTELSYTIFIEPAKRVNPDITMIIKYPQWYDRFHLFGYDLEREPALFDKVWVGTETRGQFTQRYGFVQPYEGFVNYQWIKDISGDKIGGAWFDHGDCDANDFIEQAYQTVLAGAKEIIIFNYGNFVNGHKGHHLLRTQFHLLVDLAKSVAENSVTGIAGYKPIHSDAGGDLYIMDFIGSLGIPLIPYHEYPENAKVIFLPTQAASDKDIYSKIEKSLSQNVKIFITTGFLANAVGGEKLASLVGIEYPTNITPIKADYVFNNGKSEKMKLPLDLESELVLTIGTSFLNAKVGSKSVPFFVSSSKNNGKIFLINSHTFSQCDFDKVGEVLLCPKPLGLMEIPQEWANTIRNTILSSFGYEFNAPTRITLQSLGDLEWVIHNYNQTKETISFTNTNFINTKLYDGFTRKKINASGENIVISLEPRSRIWIKSENNNDDIE